MKPMVFNTMVCAGLNVSRGEGDIGDYARYHIPVAHANDKGYGIIVYMKGAFVRYNEATPTERMILVAGDTNHKVGFRNTGSYRLEATEDGAVHYCVWHESKAIRAKYRKLDLAAAASALLLLGEIGIVSAGSVVVNTEQFIVDSVMVVKSGDVSMTAGAIGATVHVFSLN
jgi:hypothetical protein